MSDGSRREAPSTSGREQARRSSAPEVRAKKRNASSDSAGAASEDAAVVFAVWCELVKARPSADRRTEFLDRPEIGALAGVAQRHGIDALRGAGQAAMRGGVLYLAAWLEEARRRGLGD
jgi:hypothetical protein